MPVAGSSTPAVSWLAGPAYAMPAPERLQAGSPYLGPASTVPAPRDTGHRSELPSRSRNGRAIVFAWDTMRGEACSVAWYSDRSAKL